MKRIQLACLCLCALALTACTTGPSTTQTRAGLTSDNSPLNKVTQIDDQGTTVSEVGTTTDWISQTPTKTTSQTTGMVTRTVIYKDKEGHELSVRSGSDIAASGLEIDPNTGTFKIATFSTSSSAPLTALGDAQEKYQATIQALSADKRAVLQAGLDTIKGVAPGLFDLIAKSFGIP